MTIFVYGTLKRGRHNSSLLKNATYLGQYFTDKGYTLYVDRLPFMVQEKDGQGVMGELYKIDNTIRRNLDLLEGHPSYYKRTPIVVYDIEVGHSVATEAYIYQGKPTSPITMKEY